MKDSVHLANAETKSVQAPTPEVLNIIRTAAAGCHAVGNSMAGNELLTASIMTRGLLEALQVVVVYADRRQKHGKEMPTLGQWREVERVARAAIAKATGAA